MIRTLVIDDEPLARSLMKSYISKLPELELVGECSDGFEAIKAIAQLQPDLLFLDVQMPKLNGFELLEIIPNPPAVIFTTAHDIYAMKAFDVQAIDYLLKPFSFERFQKAVNKWQVRNADDTASKKNFPAPDLHARIVIKDGTDITVVPTNTIQYIEAYDDYVKIHTPQKTHIKKATMNYLETGLAKETFLRIHRSYILNINELTRIHTREKNQYYAQLKSGQELPISRTVYSKLKEVLGV